MRETTRNSPFDRGIHGVHQIRGQDGGRAGAHVDDNIALPLDHDGEHGVGGPRGAVDIDPDQVAHQISVHLVQVARVQARQAGVVDEHPHAEAPDRLLEPLHGHGEPLVDDVEHEDAHLWDLGGARP